MYVVRTYLPEYVTLRNVDRNFAILEALLPSALARGSEWGIYIRMYVRTEYVTDRNVAGFLPAN